MCLNAIVQMPHEPDSDDTASEPDEPHSNPEPNSVSLHTWTSCQSRNGLWLMVYSDESTLHISNAKQLPTSDQCAHWYSIDLLGLTVTLCLSHNLYSFMKQFNTTDMD